MKKRKKKPLEIDVRSYGLYTKWDGESKDLPKFQKCTLEVPAEVGVEFGLIVRISRAKGRYLDFLIEHPPFLNSAGEMEPSFGGTFRVKHNPFEFFLGDTIWEPIEDKKGEWTLSIFEEEEVLVSMTFVIV